MTHTYVECAVSPAAHSEIKAALIEAGYSHAIEGDTIDMHGLALVVDTAARVEPACRHAAPVTVAEAESAQRVATTCGDIIGVNEMHRVLTAFVAQRGSAITPAPSDTSAQLCSMCGRTGRPNNIGECRRCGWDALGPMPAPAAPMQPFQLPPMNEHLLRILGTMCFTCIPTVRVLRASGQQINTRAEDEQAAVIHLFLNMYLQHGDDWIVKTNEKLRTMHAAFNASLSPSAEKG